MQQLQPSWTRLSQNFAYIRPVLIILLLQPFEACLLRSARLIYLIEYDTKERFSNGSPQTTTNDMQYTLIRSRNWSTHLFCRINFDIFTVRAGFEWIVVLSKFIPQWLAAVSSHGHRFSSGTVFIDIVRTAMLRAPKLGNTGCMVLRSSHFKNKKCIVSSKLDHLVNECQILDWWISQLFFF